MGFGLEVEGRVFDIECIGAALDRERVRARVGGLVGGAGRDAMVDV